MQQSREWFLLHNNAKAHKPLIVSQIVAKKLKLEDQCSVDLISIFIYIQLSSLMIRQLYKTVHNLLYLDNAACNCKQNVGLIPKHGRNHYLKNCILRSVSSGTFLMHFVYIKCKQQYIYFK